ncbi:MAG: zinc-binding dehydrogenase [Acidobacteriota bacterium]
MREVVVSRHGSPDVMEVRESPVPQPGAGEVRIRVKAAGVSFLDVLSRAGHFPDAPRPPFIPGFEVSGYVDAVGLGPGRHEVGRHVLALTKYGGYADMVVAPAEYAFGVPSNLSHNEAAAVPISYLTALLALYRMANLKGGETVLVQGAGGGVGTAALQLARLRRAAVLGTASVSKHNALRSFGVDHVLDHDSADLERDVLRITGGRGVDVVLDALGGDHVLRGYRMLAPLGRLVSLAAQDMVPGQHRGLVRSLQAHWQAPRFGVADLMNDNRAVFGLHVLRLWNERRLVAGAMEALLTDLASGRLKPVIAKTFPLARAADAHKFIQDRGNIGKVVLTV